MYFQSFGVIVAHLHGHDRPCPDRRHRICADPIVSGTEGAGARGHPLRDRADSPSQSERRQAGRDGHGNYSATGLACSRRTLGEKLEILAQQVQKKGIAAI